MTVSSRVTRGLLRYAVSTGLSEDALLTQAGLGAEALADVEGRVPAHLHGRLWEAAVAASDDPDFGLHLGAQMPPTDVSLVGFVLVSASTLGEAYADMARYFTLFTDTADVRLDLGGDGRPASLTLRPASASYLAEHPRHPTESMLATLSALPIAVTGRRLPGLHVAFAHPRPSTGTVAHEALFGVVPTFGAEEACLSFDAGALAWPGLNASPQLHASLEDQADDLLGRLHPSIPQQVARAVAERFRGGVPTLADVAADLAMGERSLQRHLEEEGTTFLNVVNEVRREMAMHYLEDGRSTLHEVAFALGYSEPSAFHRAFRRWTGQTAGAYQAEHS